MIGVLHDSGGGGGVGGVGGLELQRFTGRIIKL